MKPMVAGGRAVTLEYLEQRRTYAGVLCGRFSAADHDRRIAEAVQEAERRNPWLDRIHVLPPVRTPLRVIADNPVPHAERLPAVMSIGLFQSGSPARDESAMFSYASLLWFQDDFELPDERTMATLRDVDWSSVARDGSP